MAFEPLPPVPEGLFTQELWDQLQNSVRQMNREKGLSPSGQKYQPLTPAPATKGIRLNQMDYRTLLAMLSNMSQR